MVGALRDFYPSTHGAPPPSPADSTWVSTLLGASLRPACFCSLVHWPVFSLTPHLDCSMFFIFLVFKTVPSSELGPCLRSQVSELQNPTCAKRVGTSGLCLSVEKDFPSSVENKTIGQMASLKDCHRIPLVLQYLQPPLLSTLVHTVFHVSYHQQPCDIFISFPRSGENMASVILKWSSPMRIDQQRQI